MERLQANGATRIYRHAEPLCTLHPRGANTWLSRSRRAFTPFFRRAAPVPLKPFHHQPIAIGIALCWCCSLCFGISREHPASGCRARCWVPGSASRLLLVALAQWGRAMGSAMRCNGTTGAPDMAPTTQVCSTHKCLCTQRHLH